MAFTATQPFRVSATLKDETGTTASAPSYGLVDPSQTITQLVNDAQAWAVALDAISDAQMISLHVDIAVALPAVGVPGTGIKAAPLAGARVEQTGVLNFRPASVLRRYGQIIPAIAEALLGSGDKINLGNAAVTTFMALLDSGSTATVLAYTNQAQQVLTAFVDSVTSFRKRRRQLSRSSFERP